MSEFWCKKPLHYKSEKLQHKVRQTYSQHRMDYKSTAKPQQQSQSSSTPLSPRVDLSVFNDDNNQQQQPLPDVLALNLVWKDNN